MDTNVGLTANGLDHTIGIPCQSECIRKLLDLQRNGVLLLDSCGLILREYLKQKPFGFPQGAGDMFFVWANDNQANEILCLKVTVTPANTGFHDWAVHDHDPDLDEYPNDLSLAAFDRQDRKFVAVSLASKLNPVILNAVDSDWKYHENALNNLGVAVEFLCPEHIKIK